MVADEARVESPRDYAFAALAVAAATLVRLATSPYVGTRAPWVFYFPAIAFAAWRSGFGPSAFALLLATLAGWFLWVPPTMTFALKGTEDAYVVLAFFLSGLVIVAFGRSNQRTRHRLRDESVERERTSRALAESLESFRVLFDHADSDAVILMDANADIVAWNRGAETIFGHPGDEVLGRDAALIFVPEDREAGVPAHEWSAAAEKGSAPDNRWLLRRDGTRFWAAGSTIALHESGDGVRGFLKIVRDETLRHQLEADLKGQREALEAEVRERTADLRAANAELEGFTYSVSHDMRAPLRAIVGHARILVEDYGDQLPEDARERIDRMSKASSRMARLIEDLLTYARLGKQELRKSSVDLAQIFREVVAQEAQGLEIEMVAPDSLPVEAEPGLMRMVVENLVGNAVKYRRPDVPLRLELAPVEKVVMKGFEVRDNGIGFEMQYAPKLFEPFERLHRSEAIEGTGIGLANVRRIVQRHGGDVWAQGEPNVGSAFGFTLP